MIIAIKKIIKVGVMVLFISIMFMMVLSGTIIHRKNEEEVKEEVNMKILFEMFEKYDLEYNPSSKMLFINKPIKFVDFNLLRACAKYLELDIRDIKIGKGKML